MTGDAVTQLVRGLSRRDRATILAAAQHIAVRDGGRDEVLVRVMRAVVDVLLDVALEEQAEMRRAVDGAVVEPSWNVSQDCATMETPLNGGECRSPAPRAESPDDGTPASEHLPQRTTGTPVAESSFLAHPESPNV